MDTLEQCSDTFHTLLDPQVAMTIAVRVQLSPSLVDTCIVAATRHDGDALWLRRAGGFTGAVYVHVVSLRGHPADTAALDPAGVGIGTHHRVL